MSVQEKYVTLLELANQNGTTYELSEADGVLNIVGTSPSAEAKQAIWDEYNRVDPDFKGGDLILNLTVSGFEESAHTYTVESGDSLSKIAGKYGTNWKAIWDANRDKLNHPDKIYPGQELTIPGA
jgi:nucleoid-associated protein YgaU